MAESLVTKIENARKKIRQYKKEIPSEIGKNIIKNHKIPDTNAHGDVVKYKNGKGKIKKRKLRGYDDFKAHFKVVKKPKNPLLDTKYLVILGKKALYLFDPKHTYDYGTAYRRMKKAEPLLAKKENVKNNSNNSDDNSSNDSTDNSNNSDDANQTKTDQNDESRVE